jgi:hypothetical protein
MMSRSFICTLVGWLVSTLTVFWTGLSVPTGCQAQRHAIRLLAQPLTVWRQLELERLVAAVDIGSSNSAVSSASSPPAQHLQDPTQKPHDVWDSLVQSTLKQMRLALGTLQSQTHRSATPRLITHATVFLQQANMLPSVVMGPNPLQLLQGAPYVVTLQSTRAGFGLLFSAVAFP